jgi:hypothetical protein
MQRKLLVLVWLLFVVAFSPFVFAVVPEQISLVGCELQSSSVSCNQVLNVSCLASVNYGSAIVTDVRMYVNNKEVSASRVSGSSTNGTWVGQYTVSSSDTGKPIVLNGAFIRASGSTSTGVSTCYTNSATQLDQNSCFISFGSVTSAVNSCVCSYSTVASATTINNSVVYTRTPSAGCLDTAVVQFEEFKDFCDPGWTVQYSGCIVSNPSVNPFVGVQTKSYYSSNPSCCLQTQSAAGYVWYNHNTGSDCVEPIDHGQVVSCSIDSWMQFQGDVLNSGFSSASSFNSADYVRHTILGSSVFQPLVYDVNGDGFPELIVFSNSSMSIWRFEGGSYSLIEQQLFSYGITGQPALWGVTVVGDDVVVEQFVKNNGRPLLLVPHRQSVNGSRLGIYSFSSGGQINVHSLQLFDYDLSGVSCYLDVCYFMEVDDVGLTHTYGYYVYPDSTVLAGPVVLSSTAVDGYPASNFTALQDVLGVPGGVPVVFPVKVAGQFSRANSFVLWPMYRYDSGFDYFHGFVKVTDGFTGHLGVSRLMPVSNVQSGLWSQISYSFSGGLVVDDYVAYVSYSEVFNTSNGVKQSLGVYAFPLKVSFTDYVAPSSQSFNPKTVWQGSFSSSSEGLSNVVLSGGSPVVVGSVQSSSELSSSSFNPPVLLSQTLSGALLSEGTFVSSSDLQMYTSTLDGQYVYMSKGGVWKGIRQFDGVVVDSATLSGSKSVNSLFYDQSSDILYVGAGVTGNNLFPALYGYDVSARTSKILMTDLNVCAMVVNSNTNPSVTCVDPSFVRLQGVYDGRLYWVDDQWGSSIVTTSRMRSIPVGVTTSSCVNVSSCSSAGLLYSTPSDVITVSGLSLIANNSVEVAFSFVGDTLNVSDFALFTGSREQYLFGLENTFAGSGADAYGGSTNNLGLRTISLFNHDLNSPRWISTTGNKVKVSSWDPFVYSQPVATCGADFYPVFYNSDRHILGITTNPNKMFVRPGDGLLVPQFAYCDFSDEAVPKVVAYHGTPVPWVGNVSSGAVSVNPPRVVSSNNLYDGSGSYSLVIAGCWHDEVGTCAGDDGSQSGLIVQVWSLDRFREPAVDSAGAFSFAVGLSYNSLVGLVDSSFVVSGFSPVAYASVADWYGSGYDSVVVPSGVYSFNNLSFRSFNVGSSQLNEFVLPFDQNNDGVLDLFADLGQSFSHVYISNPIVSSLQSGPLELKNLRCQVLPGSGRVAVQVFATAPDPSRVAVSIDSGSGFVSRSVSSSGEYFVQYSSSGSKRIRVMVRSTVDGSSDTKSCDVVVSLPSAKELSCSMGVDGEFSYTSSIVNHGWSVVRGSSSRLLPSSGILMTQFGDSIQYPLSGCLYDSITVEARLQNSQRAIFAIVGSDPSNVFAFRFDERTGTLYNQDGVVLKSLSSFIQMNDVRFVIARSSGTVSFYFGDELLFTQSLGSFNLASVVLENAMFVDYVRLTSSGDIVFDDSGVNYSVVLTGNVDSLRSCVDVSAHSSRVSRLSYSDVSAYCSSLSKGYCSVLELQAIANSYGDCSKQTYNYCVYEEYPRVMGLPRDSSSYQGGTFCSGLLVTYGTYSTIVSPFVSQLWGVLTSNILVFLLIVFVVVVIVPLIIHSRRR